MEKYPFSSCFVDKRNGQLNLCRMSKIFIRGKCDFLWFSHKIARNDEYLTLHEALSTAGTFLRMFLLSLDLKKILESFFEMATNSLYHLSSLAITNYECNVILKSIFELLDRAS